MQAVESVLIFQFVLIYPKSTKLGISNVKLNTDHLTKSRSYILDLPKNYLKNLNKKFIYLNVGDLAIFDFLLLHAQAPLL